MRSLAGIIGVAALITAVLIGGSSFSFGQLNIYNRGETQKTATDTASGSFIISGNSTNFNRNNNNNSLAIQRSHGQQQLSINGTTPSSAVRVAFVRPTFTYAAYQLNGFYNFYDKYDHTPDGTNVTSDLNLLTVKVPHGPFLVHSQKNSDTPPEPREKKYIDIIMQHVQNNAPRLGNIKIYDITDENVHDGSIFSRNGSNGNAYDVLFLFHQEYVTQSEYNNLKKFVADGGTIVFNDANVLTVEVSYNKSDDTVKFIKGHNWQYDGKSAAWRAEAERWTNQTRQWVGSNFMQDPTKDNVTFSDNPFNYRHSEEQYVSNPSDKIIFNFGATEHDSKIDEISQDNPNAVNETVAMYEHSYGKGKVIMLSIFSYKLAENKTFLDFYDKEIIPRAFSSIQNHIVNVAETT